MTPETVAMLGCVLAAAAWRPDTEWPLLPAVPPALDLPREMVPDTQDTTRWPGPVAKVLTMEFSPKVQLATSEFDRVAAELDSYLQLAPGWDGEHSQPPSAAAVRMAKAFLRTLPLGVPPPRPMVSRTGAAELYWDLATGYVDVSFEADGAVSVFAENPEGRDFFIEDAAPDFLRLPRLPELLALLAPRQLQIAA